MLQETLFTDVLSVEFIEMRQMEFVKIVMQKGKSLLFRTGSSYTSTMKWYKFCGLLFKIPKYAIPEIPKENNALLHKYAKRSTGNLIDNSLFSYIYMYHIVTAMSLFLS